MRNSPQQRLGFHWPLDPHRCAKALCRKRKAKRPTHTVTIGKYTYNVCAECARQWEGMRGVRVESIAAEVAS